MAGLPETAEDGKTLSDAWDYKGRPAVKSQTGGWASAAMIFGFILSKGNTVARDCHLVVQIISPEQQKIKENDSVERKLLNVCSRLHNITQFCIIPLKAIVERKLKMFGSHHFFLSREGSHHFDNEIKEILHKLELTSTEDSSVAIDDNFSSITTELRTMIEELETNNKKLKAKKWRSTLILCVLIILVNACALVLVTQLQLKHVVIIIIPLLVSTVKAIVDTMLLWLNSHFDETTQLVDEAKMMDSLVIDLRSKYIVLKNDVKLLLDCEGQAKMALLPEVKRECQFIQSRIDSICNQARQFLGGHYLEV